MKKLQLVFSTASNANLTINFTYPKEGISKAEVDPVGAALVPILVSDNGAEVTGFLKGVIIETQETVL